MDMSFINGVKNAETEITPLDQLKLAIVGPPKTGKSRLAATGRKPVYVADFDDRAESLAGLPEVYVKTYFDANPLAGQAFANFLTDLNMFEYKFLQGAKPGIDIPKTISLDSMTYFINANLRYVMSQNSAGVKQLNLGGMKVNIPRGYDPYTGETSYTVNVIERIIAMEMDVIAVFHERPEETPDSTQENPKFTGKYSVHPPRAAGYLALFNELWHVKYENGKYLVQVKPSYDFQAATCLSGLSDEEEPNIEKMIEKHMMAFQNKK